jgi:hypothetical protein
MLIIVGDRVLGLRAMPPILGPGFEITCEIEEKLEESDWW